MKATLDIIIVNWNSREQLAACLASVAATRRAGFELERVVVVDNASTDGSAVALERADLKLTVIRNRENRGFAAACNQGARDSAAKYLLFLNPDTLLFSDSLAVPVAHLERPVNEGVGICGIQLVDDEEVVSRSCSRFPTPLMFVAKMVGVDRFLPARLVRQAMLEWEHDDDRDVDQVIGAFFLVRRSLFDRLDGFDERFFVYFEEVDFSLRAAAAGARSRFLAGARAYHRGGGCSDSVKARRLEYYMRSRMEYGIKHYSRARATLLTVVTLCVEPLARGGFALMRGAFREAAEVASGYRNLWKAAPGLLWRSTFSGPH